MALLPPDPVFTFNQRIGPVNSLCFHHHERLFAGTQKGQVYLFDLQTNRSTFNMTIGENPLLSIRHSEDYLFSMEKGGTFKQNQLTNSGYKLANEIQQEHTGFCGFDCSSEDNIILAPKDENCISVLSLDTLKEIHKLTVPPDTQTGPISCVKYLNMHYALAAYSCGYVMLWDLRSYKILAEERFNDCITSIDYDLVTNRGIIGSACDKIELFSFNTTDAKISKKADLQIKNPGVNCVKIRKDLKVFVSGGFDGRLRVFSWKSKRLLTVLSEHKGNLMDIAFSDGPVSFWKANIMAASGSDGKITLWDIYN
ncbi:guanine nucleotide-binding protein subunit beta-like protein 1 [Culicoides brevitarsis]|uniref:guanine nucleotide-binding protein subunit beta-like protein 1 n=1 Tax=Culicoides brevitarsis TaxID=469753 RepID=UPI00307C980D